MNKNVVLDSWPLSILATPPKKSGYPVVQAMRQWAEDCDRAGFRFIICEVIDYEIRRELLRANKLKSIAELDKLKSEHTYFPITTAAMLKAAELWAKSRQQGQLTAHEENIDVDVILAAQVITSGLPQSDIVVATANLRHLTQFVSAELWQNIKP